MKKRFSTLLIILLIAALTTTTVWAGGLKLSGASITSGSPLTLNGTLSGLIGFTEGVTVMLEGFGRAINVTCTNPGGNSAPGQPGQVTSTGVLQVSPLDIDKQGAYRIRDLTASDISVAGHLGPNKSWTASYVIAWDSAQVIVTDSATGVVVKIFYFTCFPSDPNNPSAYTCTQNK
jgi:hypothetical protein